MAKILITGGAGFIGSSTANELVRTGHAVRVLDNLDPQIHPDSGAHPRLLGPEVQFIRGDVRDAEALARALEGIEIVYHFAALTGVTQSMFEIDRYLDVNVRGTGTLWDVIINRRLNVERVILSSSRAVYGEGTYYCVWCATEVFPQARSAERLARAEWDVLCPLCGQTVAPVATREDRPTQPLSVYAQTKLFQEEICRSLAREAGIERVILRYFNVYGPNQSLSNPYTGIAATFCARLRGKNPISLYEDGLAIRDFVHIRDIVKANLLALTAGENESAINVGSGIDARIVDLAEAIAEIMELAGNFQVTGQYRAGDVRSCYAETSRARQLLRFSAETGLRDGLSDLVKWVLESGALVDKYDESVSLLESKGVLFRGRGVTSA